MRFGKGERFLILGLGACALLAWGATALQYAATLLAPTLARLADWFWAHWVWVGLALCAVLFLRWRWRRSRPPAAGPMGLGRPVAPPAAMARYRYDPRIDRRGPLGALGRWLAQRHGGPLIR